MNASDLATFEALSEKLYASTNAYEREQAGRALQMFVQPPAKLDSALLTQAQFVLDNSTSRYALVLAATCLTKVIGDHWSVLTSQTRLGLRTFLLLPDLCAFSASEMMRFIAIRKTACCIRCRFCIIFR
jgi:hypothetical protein